MISALSENIYIERIWDVTRELVFCSLTWKTISVKLTNMKFSHWLRQRSVFLQCHRGIPQLTQLILSCGNFNRTILRATGSPSGGNTLQVSDIYYPSLKRQEETNYKCLIFFPLLYTHFKRNIFKNSVLPWQYLVPPELNFYQTLS